MIQVWNIYLHLGPFIWFVYMEQCSKALLVDDYMIIVDYATQSFGDLHITIHMYMYTYSVYNVKYTHHNENLLGVHVDHLIMGI